MTLSVMTSHEKREPPPLNIAIVGGGLGGVILAIGLLRQGISVKIYEAAEGFGEIGAGVACGRNAVNALSLISPDLIEAYKRHATCNRSPERESTWLSLRYGKQPDDNGSGKSRGDLMFHIESEINPLTGTLPRSCVHRARLLDEIVQLLPPGLADFNKRLTKLENLPDEDGGGVRMDFADGTSVTADAVIGCDGIKSVARAHLYGSELRPTFTEAYGYRALVPAKACEAIMGPELTYDGQAWVGRGGCIITYPVDHGNFVNMVAVVFRPGSEWAHDAWLLPATAEEMLSDLEGWHPGLVELFASHSSRDKWALHDLIHNEKYFRGRVCLLGDSCHASTPHLGAGAGQAMEDAYVLSNLLGRVQGIKDLDRAFVAYDAVRRPRSQTVVKNSRQSGLTLAMLAEGVGGDPKKIEDAQYMQYHTVWHEDLQQQLQLAMSLMEEHES